MRSTLNTICGILVLCVLTILVERDTTQSKPRQYAPQPGDHNADVRPAINVKPATTPTTPPPTLVGTKVTIGAAPNPNPNRPLGPRPPHKKAADAKSAAPAASAVNQCGPGGCGNSGPVFRGRVRWRR